MRVIGGDVESTRPRRFRSSRHAEFEPLTIDDVEPLKAELESFLDSVRTGTPPAVTAEDGAAAVRLAADIVKAIAAHNWQD